MIRWRVVTRFVGMFLVTFLVAALCGTLVILL